MTVSPGLAAETTGWIWWPFGLAHEPRLVARSPVGETYSFAASASPAVSRTAVIMTLAPSASSRVPRIEDSPPRIGPRGLPNVRAVEPESRRPDAWQQEQLANSEQHFHRCAIWAPERP